MSKILIIVPAYNEQDSIHSTISKLHSWLYDYVVINDGSTDSTKSILMENSFNHINLPINLGIGGAVQTGYKYAFRHGYDYAIQLDADGQHDPADLDTLIKEIQNSSYDMVIGSRFVKNTDYKGSKIRRLGIFYFYLLINFLTGVKITDPTSGYRIVNRKLIEEFSNHYPVDYPEVEVLVHIIRKNYKVKEVSVNMKSRQGGISSISMLKSLYYMFKVTVFSFIRRAF